MTPIADIASPPDEDARPRYLKRVNLRTAVRIAAVFNAILGVALVLTGWMVIAVAAQRGLLDQVNRVTSDLSSGHPLHVHAVRLGIIWALVVACWTVAMTVVAGLATVIFNYVLQLFGGIELDLRTTEPERVDVEATVRGVVDSVKARLQPQPEPALRTGGRGADGNGRPVTRPAARPANTRTLTGRRS